MVSKYGLVAFLVAVVLCRAIAATALVQVANGPEAVPLFIWCKAVSRLSLSICICCAGGGVCLVSLCWRVAISGSLRGGNRVFLIVAIRSVVNSAVGMLDVSRL